MIRSSRLTALFAFLSLAFGSLLDAAERNVIFIITDDESPTLGCYGDVAARTPAIDAIAKDGVVFSERIRHHGLL